MKHRQFIFVIDEDPLFPVWFGSVFGDKTGYSVLGYSRPEEAYEEMKTCNPRFVFLNHNSLKGINVQPAILKIKALFKETRVIVMSDENNAETAVDLMRSGADDFVQKDEATISKMFQLIY